MLNKILLNHIITTLWKILNMDFGKELINWFKTRWQCISCVSLQVLGKVCAVISQPAPPPLECELLQERILLLGLFCSMLGPRHPE